MLDIEFSSILGYGLVILYSRLSTQRIYPLIT